MIFTFRKVELLRIKEENSYNKKFPADEKDQWACRNITVEKKQMTYNQCGNLLF